MRNKEFALTVLRHMRDGKTNKQIALETQKHRNTISKYVGWLTKNNVYNFKLVSNEILDELQTRIRNMNDHDLINFFAKLNPQRFESTHIEEIREIKLTWIKDDSKKET